MRCVVIEGSLKFLTSDEREKKVSDIANYILEYRQFGESVDKDAIIECWPLLIMVDNPTRENARKNTDMIRKAI
jgi:hypothetical protein